jgi:GAF domain-containing protein
MADEDLTSQLQGLFSGAGAEPEADESELQLEEIVADLLGGETEAELTAARPAAVEVPAPIPASPEEAEEKRISPADAHPRELTRGKRHPGIRSILMHGVTAIGGVLLLSLLIYLVRQGPGVWSRSHTLYIAACAVAIFITLMQWTFNFSLSRALRQAEEKRAEAVRAQSLRKEQAHELATANALLQKRTLQLQAAAQISQATGSALDPDEVMERAVKLIRERFDLHYVGLFLIDESGQWAVLRAGTGDAGRRMLAQGYKLEVDGASTIGWCTAHGEVRIAPGLDTMSRRGLAEVNLLLPETRSEMALPLRSRGRVIGALDVQSTECEALCQEDIAVLQTVAAQVAVAVDNAQLFAEMQARLEEMETRPRHPVPARWADRLSARAAPAYERTRPGVAPLGDATVSGDVGALDQAIEQAMARQEVVVQSDAGAGTGQAALVAPISLRGEALGVLGLHEAAGQRQWTDDEIALIETVADQMALAIENARLLRETQQRAERERLVADVSAQVRASTEVDTILRTAIRELGRALRASDGLIRLGAGDEAGSPHADTGDVDDDGADI